MQFSPDGRSVAFVSTRDGAQNIYTLSLGSTAAKKITDNREPTLFFSYPVWSRDGRFLVYCRQSREYKFTLINNFK